MRLDYKLLWVEDETDWVSTYEELFRDYLFDLGFKLNVQRLTKAPVGAEFSRLNLDRYHLILMDYNLGYGKNGKELIEEIRRLDVVTEIVFYTADEATYKSIQTLPLEGVYWASRDDDTFEPRIQSIIQLTIKRVMDLSAMRGLAVAEIADIDHMMNLVIKHYHGTLEEGESSQFKKQLFDKIKKSAEGSLGKVIKNEQVCLEQIEYMLHENGFVDSNKRWRAVSSIAKSCILEENCIDLLNNFEDMLQQRNDLAHGHTELSEDGADKVVGKNGAYTLEDALRIRRELLGHRDNFENILKKISQGN